MDLDRMKTRSKHVAWHFWGLISVWSLAIVIIFLSDCWHIDRTMEEIALIEARAYLDKDQSLRIWAASHGGVYVPVTAETPPNPFLEHVRERDIRTPQGRLLTLMNPAYMIRQIMAAYEKVHQVRGHITGLRYYRKETAPDDWEKMALAAFENGRQEVRQFTDSHGKECLRVMRPLVTEASCLKCHAAQGYRVGDIRGGVSITLPMDPYLDYRRREFAAHGISFALLWLLGGLGFRLAAAKLSRSMKNHDVVEEELKTSEAQLRDMMADLVRHQESERKAIAMEIHEEIAQSLSAIKMNLEAWMDAGTEARVNESQVMLAIIERIKADIELIRRLTKRLSPMMLDDLGLETAVATLCREIAETGGGCEITLDFETEEAHIPSELKIAVYRILEDLLAPVPMAGDGADCRRSVRLSASDGRLALTVQETGACGTREDDKSYRDMQLARVRNRAASFGGSVSEDSGQADSRTISVAWPLGEDPPDGGSDAVLVDVE